jgi:hypothetical protein
MSRKYISNYCVGTISVATVHTISSTRLAFCHPEDRKRLLYFIWLPTGFLPRRHGFNSRSINVVFVMDEGAVGQIILVRIIPPVLGTHPPIVSAWCDRPQSYSIDATQCLCLCKV